MLHAAQGMGMGMGGAPGGVSTLVAPPCCTFAALHFPWKSISWDADIENDPCLVKALGMNM